MLYGSEEVSAPLSDSGTQASKFVVAGRRKVEGQSLTLLCFNSLTISSHMALPQYKRAGTYEECLGSNMVPQIRQERMAEISIPSNAFQSYTSSLHMPTQA